ncbi:glycoside hydrolase family 3 protein [Couchioplanes caeruleus]|uniref:beta-N-acetylhexosaminidase n=2 Tax=Couchioplanes caeruleus TaxID=56438 RepID=A0A1K0H0T8_9ACTN|nr:glycoside hydrolase family 3 N-terminal domain-containing protein [Couchioplanes caeruleus]OJF15315.1 glycoside hydrolase family 3 [Couchioplanes caeruleus subsp. caeruleus]ROP29450.1 beta-N-acetylhexosaminidase [Couchioplanes caeruleus]
MAGVNRAFRVAVAVPVGLVLAACGSDSPSPPQAGTAAASAPAAASASARAPASVASVADPALRAREAVKTMSDVQLAGQVLMPYAYGDKADRVDAAATAGNQRLAGVDTPAQMIAKFHLGGLILVGFVPDDPTGATNPATNVDTPQQVRALTDGLQAAARDQPGAVPLLIGTDQEFGVVTRIRTRTTQLPSAMAFGAAGRPDLTEAAWRAAGTELAAMGVNLDFAPVADTLGPAGSSVIGSRAYGADPVANGAQVGAAVRGLRAAGVSATLKHFPGHGHTTGDSHDELPVVGQSAAAWEKADRPPFDAGIAAGADVVMSGHLDVKGLDKGVAATFSRKIMTDVLRGRLGFGGVAITDAMNMAPAMKLPPGVAAVRALNAGNDILLMPPDIAAARDGILAAVRSGDLKRERLVEAVTRILTLKFRTGPAQPALSVLESPGHLRAVAELNAAAVTVLKGRCSGPLVSGPVTVTASGGRESSRAALADALRQAGVPVQAVGGKVVHLVGYGDSAADLSVGAAVTVVMDTPYLLAAARSPVLMATYSSSRASLTALAAVIAGKAKAPGRSPVAVKGLPRSACG